MVDPQEIGLRILTLRRRQGLTQQQLAERAGLNSMTVGRTERGRLPETSSLVRIAEALGVSLSQLIDGHALGTPTNTTVAASDPAVRACDPHTEDRSTADQRGVNDGPHA